MEAILDLGKSFGEPSFPPCHVPMLFPVFELAVFGAVAHLLARRAATERGVALGFFRLEALRPSL